MNFRKFLLLQMILFFASCAKSSNTASSNLPLATTADIEVSRQNTLSQARVRINLDAAYSKDVLVSYVTLDGSAKAGKDFVTSTGIITIPAGSTSSYVDVSITGDSLRQAQQIFSLNLSSPVNCTLKSGVVNITIDNDGLYLPVDPAGYTSPNSYAGYTLQWSDEFNNRAVDAANWKYETGTGSSGWGNNELENYTARSQNVFVSSGNLIIEARKESYNGSNYTSTRMVSSGLQEFTYGRIDIRAKLPVSKGMWPAAWMLGSNISQVSWPACGEMDIMELVGSFPSRVTSTMHWANGGGSDTYKGNNYSLPTGDFSQQFHVFSADWQQDSVTFSVDGNIFFTLSNATNVSPANYPFNNPMFFILNLAVGGNWPGSPDDTTNFPQRMFVDYVRVFKKQ